jgi:ATP-dependent Clp protease ATP-binding subunit ClpC
MMLLKGLFARRKPTGGPVSLGTFGPFARFTRRARIVLALAQADARDLGHDYLGTEHLLLGLLREGDGVGGRVLADLGVTLPQVRRALVGIVGRGDAAGAGAIRLTPRSKRVLVLAADEAQRLGHDYLGTEHLLLALVREGDGVAAGILESLGVRLETVRARVLHRIQSPRG